MIIQNQVRCNLCGDEPFSASVHDFKSCKCGNICVDGGLEYLRRVGNTSNCTDLSYSLPDKVIEDCKAAVQWAEETGRNAFGTALAVIRALHKYNRIIVGEEQNACQA